MKIAILGSGGREHSIAEFISKSQILEKLYCIPGNAGTNSIAENIEININNFPAILKVVKDKNIDMVIVGPEKPLVNGISDFLEKNNIKVFGPNKFCAQLEGSKTFTKLICKKYNIPTANFGIFKKKNDAINFLKKAKFPIVVKADGLASGKGVYICENFEQALNSVVEIFNGKFGLSEQILIEEFLKGEEMSFFVISDGNNFKNFNTAQDHKRVGEGDTGKNTGGMGAYAPSGLINKNLEKKIIEKIIKPTFKAINENGNKYKGFLYAGLMIKDNEPYLIEFNVRMGDPECQVILPLLKNDLLELMNLCCEGKLKKNYLINWSKKKSLCIVLCSKGYPENYIKSSHIKNLDIIKKIKDNYIFHAGTVSKNNITFSNGGRVLNFISVSDEYKISREEVISVIKKLNWKDGFFRSDIGFKIIK